MTGNLAFTIDDHYDLEYASDGVSRYGAYLASGASRFVDPDNGEPTRRATRVAIAAWTIASVPIMSPGYVRWHPRVRSAEPRVDEDGRLALGIDLAVPPHPLTRHLRSVYRGWERDWSGGGWFEPFDNDGLVALSRLSVRAPIATDGLPTPDYEAGHLPATSVAKQAVRTLCALANRHLDDLLAAADPDDQG